MLTQQAQLPALSQCRRPSQRTISVRYALGEGYDSGATSVSLRSSRRGIKSSAKCSILHHSVRERRFVSGEQTAADKVTLSATRRQRQLLVMRRLLLLPLMCLLACNLLASPAVAVSPSATLNLSGAHILSTTPQADGPLTVQWTTPTSMHNDSSSAALRYTLLAETSNSQQASRSVCESTELHCRIAAGALPAGVGVTASAGIKSPLAGAAGTAQ